MGFANVKSHLQGSGRARKDGSEIFYFDNSPDEESKRTAAMYGANADEPSANPVRCAASDVQPGMGEGHQWGEEETIWDYEENKSFRGQRCMACGSMLRITSRKYGQGRKKTERLFAVQGNFV